MADFSEMGPIRVDTSFSRPHSGGRSFLADPIPRDRYSRHSGQTQHRLRDVTWVSTQSQLPSAHTHTPQTPQYAFQQARTPTPVLRKSAPTITESELDAEYMTVSVDDRDECHLQGHGYGFNEVMPVATNGKSEKRNLMGGFVSGLRDLRRLPKVMSKTRLRDHGKSERQGTGGVAAGMIETGRTTLSRYTGPAMPGIATSNSDDIPTVERLETPTRASSVSPHPRHGNHTDSDASADGRRERLLLSAVREHSFEHNSHSLHSSLHQPRTYSRSDDASTSSRAPFEQEGDVPIAMSTPILADASIRVSSPILAEPRPSADFMKMESPIRPPPAESIRSQIARAGKFVRDLNQLPWIASSGVSSIYVPGEATTRRYSRPISKNKGSSWYTSRAKPIDLFAGPSTTGLLPLQPPPPGGTGTTGQVVPAPFILGSSANLLFTHPAQMGGGGGSGSPSHEGPPSTDSHGSQPQVLAPAYVAQPLFVYPSGLPQPGGPPEAQLPRPVYMLANSSPHLMSSGQIDGSGGMGVGPRLFVPQPSGLRTPTFG